MGRLMLLELYHGGSFGRRLMGRHVYYWISNGRGLMSRLPF